MTHSVQALTKDAFLLHSSLLLSSVDSVNQVNRSAVWLYFSFSLPLKKRPINLMLNRWMLITSTVDQHFYTRLLFIHSLQWNFFIYSLVLFFTFSSYNTWQSTHSRRSTESRHNNFAYNHFYILVTWLLARWTTLATEATHLTWRWTSKAKWPSSW